MNVAPEDATAHKELFLDCSSFVGSVYNYVFGINIVDSGAATTEKLDNFARNNIGISNEVIYYVNAQTYEGDKETLLQEIWDNLQVGDLVCYRHNSSGSVGGHVMLYIGDDTFLHCTGSSFYYVSNPASTYDQATTAEKNNGAIQLLDATEVFTTNNPNSTRYLFGTLENKEIYTFEVLRPLNRNGLEFTSQAILRSFIPYIVIEKTASTPHMSTVTRGETITYSITLTNKGDTTCNNLVIRDVISELCSYGGSIDNDGTVNGNNVSWNIASLASQASITVSYTVTVNNDAEIGATIESYQATVNGVRTNKIYHTIGGLTDSQLDSIASTASSKVGNSYDVEYKDGLKFIRDVYNDAISFDFINTDLSDDVITELINTSTNTINTGNALYQLVNPNFYGGLQIKSGFVSDNLRIRNNKPAFFEKGDVIVLYNTYSSSGAHAYLYIDSSTIYGLNANNEVAVVYSGTTNVSKFLTQLIAYNKYVVLRPSLSYDPS